MTDQELQQLAKEYAEQNPPQTVDEGLRQYGMFLNATEVFEPFLYWLKKTHYIVSREKFEEVFKELEDAYNNGDNDMVEYHIKNLFNVVQKGARNEHESK